MRRAVAAGLAGSVSACVLIAVALSPGGETASAAAAPEVIGHSVGGRPIEAVQVGDPGGDRVALVVGVIHGDERAGLRLIEAIRQAATSLEGTQLWLIRTVNPDGLNMSSRKNAHEVDLNRNFPFRWRPGGKSRDSGYYPGPKPASEPETKAVMGLVERIRPDVSIWYHQDWNAVLACKGRPEDGARYAKLVPMRTSCRGNRLHGTAVSWEQHVIPGSDAFVVELAARVSPGQVTRHAAAALGIAREG
jgi:murein peptide amidase A